MFDPDPIRFDDVKPPAVRSMFDDEDPIGFGSRDERDSFGESERDSFGDGGVTPDREQHFSLSTGRFRDPNTGEFEIGGAPPDYDGEANRYRGENGRFKNGSSDLYDEPAEARFDDLSFRG